jgi:hypothetical protein
MLTVELATLARRPRTWLLAALALTLPTFFLAGMSKGTGPSPQTQDPIAYLSTRGPRRGPHRHSARDLAVPRPRVGRRRGRRSPAG